VNIFLPTIYAIDVMKAAEDISLEDAKDVYAGIPEELKDEVNEVLTDFGYDYVIKR
jgi:ribosomal protein L7/L12